MNTTTLIILSLLIIAAIIIIVFAFVQYGKHNAESLKQIKTNHDLIIGDASPYTIARAVGEYNKKYRINPDDHEVIIMYVRK